VVDGHTLSHILGTNLEPLLAELGTYCRSVCVCRASPSQKACIVKLMKEHEMKLAVGNATGVVAWKRRFEKQV
jgi:phospholipid-translocating ATPase/phospholipid-transporting ATPase